MFSINGTGEPWKHRNIVFKLPFKSPLQTQILLGHSFTVPTLWLLWWTWIRMNRKPFFFFLTDALPVKVIISWGKSLYLCLFLCIILDYLFDKDSFYFLFYGDSEMGEFINVIDKIESFFTSNNWGV